MAKTKYQQVGTDYAKEYLDKLLEMEDYIGRKIDRAVSNRVKKYIKGEPPQKEGSSDDE
ncbi:MAG: hypothetical protein IJ604_10855 [Prevotella sp.]|nr:hypothetical protein [Prevotella sp.]